MNLSDLLTQSTTEINQASTPDQLESLRIKYLGKKGLLNTTFQDMMKTSADKKALGQEFNHIKNQLEATLETKSSQLHTSSTQWIDTTAPGTLPATGHLHPMTHAIDEITRIFTEIGFTRMRYPEVDWDFFVFEGLNFPKDHPARDTQETFWVDAPAHSELGPMVLSTHTSNGQVREMQRVLKYLIDQANQSHDEQSPTAPIRMINIAKCYRRQQDLTHTHMFHQFEGMVIDQGINITHLKGTIDYFCHRFYGPNIKSRLRPHNFRFTEPSFEVDFTCTLCEGKTTLPDGSKCRFCKGGWLEVGGTGMIHPNVLKAGGYNPDKVSGFAFGWGVERAYTIKPGLQIPDIRLFYNNSYDFLQQF